MATLEMKSPEIGEPKAREPSNTRREPGIRLVFLQHPNGTSNGATRKRVRSYAAKQGHARVRHEQVAKYQESKRREAMQSYQRGNEVIAASALPPPDPCTLLSAAPTDPFASTARPVSMFEHFLLDHYLSVVVPAGNFQLPSFPTPQEYLQGAKMEWIPLALTDPGMLSGILASACRSLHALYGKGPYLEKALKYKMMCMASIRSDISNINGVPRDTSIAKAIILAADEVAVGDVIAGQRHVQAANQLVALKGGPEKLGTNGFLGGLVYTFSCAKRTDAEALNVILSYSHFRDPEII